MAHHLQGLLFHSYILIIESNESYVYIYIFIFIYHEERESTEVWMIQRREACAEQMKRSPHEKHK